MHTGRGFVVLCGGIASLLVGCPSQTRDADGDCIIDCFGSTACADGVIFVAPAESMRRPGPCPPPLTPLPCPPPAAERTCLEGCGASGRSCREDEPRVEGDACALDADCSPALELSGPHGRYLPVLSCMDSVCTEAPREWCNDVDDTGEGEIDEGCGLVATSIPITLEGEPLELLGGRDTVAIVLRTDGSLLGVQVHDAALAELARWPLPAQLSTLGPSDEGFTALGASLVGDMVVSDVVTLSVTGETLRSLRRGPELRGARLAHPGSPLRLLASTEELLSLDPITGALQASLPLAFGVGETRQVVGPYIVVCDGPGLIWIDADLRPTRGEGFCAPWRAGDGEALWTFGGAFARHTLARPTQSFPAAPSTAGAPLALTASVGHADLWVRDTPERIRVTRLHADGTVDIHSVAASETLVGAVSVGPDSVALLTGADGARFLRIASR